MRKGKDSIKSIAVILLLGALITLPTLAHSQEAPKWWGGPDETTEPQIEAAPMDLNGCWVGPENDQGGTGQLSIDFVQERHHIKFATEAAITFSDGIAANGPIHGSVHGKRFKAGFHQSHCNISFKGKLDNNADLIGKFNFKCPKINIDEHFKGTFDLTRSATGCSD
jgi:hypothetical protein